MEGDLIRINHWLLPLSWLYGVGVSVRNLCYDTGVLKTQTYDIPIISIGNLTVCGTGKTPHIEFLVSLLQQRYQVAVLSRGYKRKSKGYVLATTESTVTEIGDEPWQIKQKFPNIHVAVDSNRKRGIDRLRHDPETSNVQIILLDDAFQHRSITPSGNILLVDYHRMVTDDRLLPAGRLREPISSLDRATMVIVTKCPQNITPMGYRVIQSALNLRPFQKLYFSTLHYKRAHQLFGDESFTISTLRGDNSHVMLLTGIGNPQQMEQDVRIYAQHVQAVTFPDHHYFTPNDVRLINQRFASMPKPRLILTTEKDAARLRKVEGLSDEVRSHLYVLPIEVEVMRGENESLTEEILTYVH